MAIQVADGFSLQSQKPIDDRLQFDTVANMKAYAENSLYNGCFAYVIANKTYYTFDSSNTVDSTTGKWREFSGGGSGATTLGNLTDVDVSTAQNGELLTYSSSEQKWKNNTGLADFYKTTDSVDTAIDNADYIPFYDFSTATKKRTLWSNIKSVLKTYFDTLYSTTKTRGTATSGGTTLSLVNTGDMYNWNTDSVIYCTSSTSASTAAKVATVSRGTFTLVAGAKVCVKFTYSNTASAPTLNVASTGAKNIKYIGTDGVVETPNVWWGAGDIVTFIYDGTQFLMQLTYGMPSMPTLGVINRSDIYSTTEKVIGCWTDGRPIYQKTINAGALPNSTSKTFAHGISNINQVVNATAMAMNTTANRYMPLSYAAQDDPSLAVAFFVDRTNVIFGTAYDWSGFNATYVTLHYTKTTDAANSYNYADENDYSTSEKIIGTWIDGKKIYQKVLTGTTPASTADYSHISIGANVDTIIKITGYFGTAGGSCIQINNTNAKGFISMFGRTNSFSTSEYKNTIEIQMTNSDWGNRSCTVIVQYTKTT